MFQISELSRKGGLLHEPLTDRFLFPYFTELRPFIR